jgi:glycine hydroxymethyltransferase
MKEKEMGAIAEFIRRVLVEGEDAAQVKKDVVDFRAPFQTVYYCFDHGKPPGD